MNARARWMGMVVVIVCCAGARGEFKSPTVIQDARIVVKPGEVIEKGSVLIEEGRIRAVGAVLSVPAGAEVLDGAGLVVYAGFVDGFGFAGVEGAEPEAKERARFEDESPDVVQGPQSASVGAYRRLVHPHWKAEELFDGGSEEVEAMRRSGFAAGLVSPRTAILAGSGALMQFGDAPRRRSVLRAGAAQHGGFVTGAERGRGHGRGQERGPELASEYPTSVIGAVALFRQTMLDAGWHRELVGWTSRHPEGKRPPVDRDLEALWGCLDGDMPVAFLANRENEIHRALNMAAEFKLRPIIVGGREGWRVAERLKREDVPVLVSLKWSKEPKESKEPKQEEGSQQVGEATSQPGDPAVDPRLTFDDSWEERRFETRRAFEERVRLWGEEVDNARRLQEAGVRIGFATFEMKSADEVMEKVRKAIERGLPEEVAIEALTIGTARVWGEEGRLGTIEAGKIGNLTVMTKGLAEKEAKVRWVFVDGKRYECEKREQGGKGGNGEAGGRGEESKEAAETATTGGAEEMAAASSAESEVSSQAASSQVATSGSAGGRDWPEFACEIEADRTPRLKTGGSVLIRNANLLTVSRGDLMGTDLLVKDGRIAEIGRGLSAPEGVRVLDLPGYYVMPGIIDPHSHICSDGGVNEGSLSVTAEVRIGDAVDSRDVSAYRALAGGVTTIHTMHGSANTIGGQNAVLRLKYGRSAAEWKFGGAARTVKFALGENVKQSNWGTKGTRFPNTRMGVEAVLRRSFDAAREYAEELEGFTKEKAAGSDPMPVRRDLRLEALAEVIAGEIWVNCHCYRADEILRLFAVAEDYGFRIAVLQHVLEGYRVIPEALRHGCGASTFSDWWAYKLEAFFAIPQNAARMSQAGIVTSVNSDSAEVMRHLNLEAAKSMRFGGLSANEALRLCTINGAIQFGIDRWVGSIETGKSADLAVFGGHPLDTTSRCVLTFIEGECYFEHPGFDAERAAAARAGREFGAYREPMRVPASGDGRYWILGGTVHPVSSAAVENGLVVISDERIEYVGAAGDRRAPEGAVVVDAKGLHVYPGLINLSTSLGMSEIGSVAGGNDQGDIALVQPDLGAHSAFNPFSSAINVTRSEGVTAAMLVPVGGAVSGRGGMVRMEGWSMPESAVEGAAPLCVSLPSLPVRWPDEMPEEDKSKQIKEHRERFGEIEAFSREARRYAEARVAGEGDPRSGAEFDRRLEAMRPSVNREEAVWFSANSYKEILEAVRFAERFGVRAVIHGGRESWKLADELARREVDVVFVRPANLPSGEFEPFDSVYRCAGILERAGVRFCIATGGASLAKQLGVEAGMAVGHGLSEEGAIRAITLDAARIGGVDDRWGSIEVGKSAELVVCTDSPLQACNGVVVEFIGGRPVDLSNQHTELDAKWLGRPRPRPRLAPEQKLRGPAPMRVPVNAAAGSAG